MVTRQPQVERRTAKVRLSETDVLPLSHETNTSIHVEALPSYLHIRTTVLAQINLGIFVDFGCV